MSKKKVALIGSGFGGLSAAIYLSEQFDVDVYEKNSNAGGKANYIKENGFRFDKGPSLLTMPFVVKDVFDFANENIDEYLSIKKLDIYCKYFWSDGSVINAFSNYKDFENEIKKISVKDANNLKKFLKYTEKIYNLTANLFLFKSFSELSTFFNINALKTLLQIWKIDPFKSMHKSISNYFENEKVIQLFDRYATYNGSNPYKAPATLNIIPHVEYNIGGFIPEKGIYSIVEALHKLALKREVKFHFNKDVSEIVIEKNKVVGLKLLDEENVYRYDLIISNSDVNFTYQNLLKGIKTKESIKYQNLELSSSALVFYWGIKGSYEELEIHNILFSEDYKKEFDEIFEERTVPTDPTIYIYISSKYNKDDAPLGFENWFVMINTPNHNGQNWEEILFNVKTTIINKIKKVLKIDISDKIVFEKFLTPIDIEKETSSYKGSLYGISSNNRQAAFLRQQNKSKEIEGLYFCGGSAHPGGGIPLTILSGKITAELLKKYEL